MNIFNFVKTFKTEKACINYIKDLRLENGITCKKCNKKEKHYWLKSVNKFQCSVCRSRTNIKSGTIMEKSKLSIQMWLTAIHLITTTKKSFSALELQRQLGISCYETVWYMLLKIRIMMGKRDSKYTLKGDIEVDDAFFETYNDRIQKDQHGQKILKRGRGSQRQSKVLVMVESTPKYHEIKNKKKRVMGYVKMSVVDSLDSKTINYELNKGLDKESTIYTDAYKGYNKALDVVDGHIQDVVEPKEAMIKLPWVHTIISNSKKMTLGIHHFVKSKYLQSYLSEFCYKLNRRNFEYRDMFDGLALACIDSSWKD